MTKAMTGVTPNCAVPRVRPKFLSIFRPMFLKDTRHLWPQILIFVALVMLGAVIDPTYTHRNLSTVESLIWTALPLACCNLVIAVIHEERLPGDRQYWLTRPYSRGGLLATKAGFVAAFVNLPVFLSQATVLGAMGIPPLHHLSTLLWRQVFFAIFLVLPAAALAAVTRNLKQVFLAALMILTPLFLLALVFNPFRSVAPWAALYVTRLMREEFGLRSLTTPLIIGGGAMLILFIQFARRATILSRTLVAGAIVLTMACATLVPPDQDFAIQAMLSPPQPNLAAVHVGLDPRPHPPDTSDRRAPRVVHLEIPVRVDGVPPDLALSIGMRAEAALSIASSPSREGWRVYSEIRPPGRRWLCADMDRDVFDRLNRSLVDLDGSVELTLFARAGTLPTPGTHAVVVPGVGSCSNQWDIDGTVSIVCYSPFPRNALALEFPGGGRHWIISRSTVDVLLPTYVDFQPLQKFTSPTSFANLEELSRLNLVAEQPVARIRPQFHFRALRLSDYTYPKQM